MRLSAERRIEESEGSRPARVALGLGAGAFLLLGAAGALLWWRHGDAVFAQYLLGALAWCF